MFRIDGMKVLVDGVQIATLYQHGGSNTISNVNRKGREVRVTGAPIGMYLTKHTCYHVLE